MFFQPTNESSQNDNSQLNVLPSISLPRAKKKNNKRRYNKKGFKKNHSKLACTMSTWAENFTVAATWQLKHQVAYWKARAKALEYENGVLHDVIRRNQHVLGAPPTPHLQRESSFASSTTEQMEESENEDDDYEVSEEFIQFLATNAKFKEDAKREREILKAKLDAEECDQTPEKPQETEEEKRERLQGLYGDKWQRISARETSLMSMFISECDKSKPVYWPNIPLNFNCS